MQKLAKGQSLDLIVRELREEILEGKLKPGERIHQQVVAERFGTSRLPVREALKLLQNEGLVVVLPNMGARVARLDAAELDEVYWLRERLEPLAIERSVPNLTDEQVQALRADVETMERLSRTPNQEAAWLATDKSFHATAIAEAESPRLLQIVEGLWNVAEQYRLAYMRITPESRGLAEVEHRLLVDAFERRAGEDAARLLEVHIRRTRLALAQHPEIFDH
jgi:DNA-binding GntR family transcriptional regulator